MTSLASPRRFLITGANGALGMEVVRRFMEGGDAVVAVHSPKSSPRPLPGVEWVGVELTDRSAVRNFFAGVGEIDGVIHCAGGFRYGPVDSFGEEDLRFLHGLNFESAYYVASEAVRAMKIRRHGGVLLFISSIATLNPTPGLSAYAASKAALNALVTTLAVELRADGIRVNAVLPSVIDTPANRKDMPSADPGKWVAPGDIAELLYILSLPRSKSITGALIPMTGEA